MSDPDSTPRRRPPTIDLTAKEVVSEQVTPEQAPAAADPAGVAGENACGNVARGVGPYAAGAVGGVIVAAAIAGAVWLAGWLPARQAAPVSGGARYATAVQTAAISARLDRIETALKAPRSDVAVAAGLASAEAQTKALGAQIAALARRVDEVAAASPGTMAQAKAAAAAAAAAKIAAENGVQRHDVDALDSRVGALEETVKSLAAAVARQTSGADDRAARATVAAEALRAAVERGAPYPAELAAAEALGADRDATAALAPFAADGIPDAKTLGRELTALDAPLQRSLRSHDGSFLSRLESQAQNLVRVTPVDVPAAPAAVDPSSLIARIGDAAARGDIAAALVDIARLPDAARAVAAAWVRKAQAREAAIAASRRIAADALNALSRPASQ